MSDVIEKEYLIYKVSSKSNVPKLTGALYKSILEGNEIELQAVGAGAVNQSVKALASVREKLCRKGIDFLVLPFFRDIPNFDENNKDTISAIVLKIIKMGDNQNG